MRLHSPDPPSHPPAWRTILAGLARITRQNVLPAARSSAFSLAAVLLTAAAAALAPACTSQPPGHDNPVSTSGSGGTTVPSNPGSDGSPGSSASATQVSPSSSAQQGPTLVTPYFIRDGKVATGSPRPATGDAYVDAINFLAAGPDDIEKASGLITAVASNAKAYRLTVTDGTATVDLSRTFETRDTQPQVAQVVFTLTQFPGVDKVKFLIEGTDNGATGVPPVGRDQLTKYTPDVLLESPWPGTRSGASVRVSGNINPGFSSFEYRIDGAAGQQVASGTVNVRFGQGRRRFDQSIDVPGGITGPARFTVLAPTGSTMTSFAVSLTLTG